MNWQDVQRSMMEQSNRLRPPNMQVTQMVLDKARGIVPLSIVFNRVKQDNPSLSPNIRQGEFGGFALVPIRLALALNADPTDPWSSVYVLLQRLRSIADVRMNQLAELWKPFWNRGEIDNATGLMLSDAYNKFHTFPMGAGASLYGSLQLATSGRHGFRYIGDIDDIQLFGYFTQYSGQIAAIKADKPETWPINLAYDQGFWGMVLLEDRIGSAMADKIWSVLLSGKYARFMSSPDEDTTLQACAAFLMDKMIFTRDVFEMAMGMLAAYTSLSSDIRSQLNFSATDLPYINGHMAIVSTMLPAEKIIQSVANPYYRTSTSEVIGTVAPWTAQTSQWAGALYVEQPGTEVPEGFDPNRQLTSTSVKFGWGTALLIGIPIAGLTWYALRGESK